MAIAKGNVDINKISLGSTEIAKISLGEVEVWSSEIILDFSDPNLWEKGWILSSGSEGVDGSNRKGIRVKDYINAETQRIKTTVNGSQYVLYINMWNGNSHLGQGTNVQNIEFNLAANTTRFRIHIRNVDQYTDVTIPEASTAKVKIQFL